MLKSGSLLAGLLLVAYILPPELLAQRPVDVTQITPDAMTFQPFPEEQDAQIAVLYGNPAETGHYIVRLRFAENWTGRPHVHGGAELLTVQSGTCYFAHGDDLTRDAAAELPAGSFTAFPAGTHMRGFTGEEGCVVDVQGQGPFTTRYLDEEGGREDRSVGRIGQVIPPLESAP